MASPTAKLAVGIVLMALSGCCSPPPCEPAGIALRYEWHGNIEESGFREPSGLDYHPGRGTLFLVGDEGDLAEMNTEGEILRQKTLRAGADLEGITVVPETGVLYLAVEGEEKILEVDPESLEPRREFSIPRSAGGEELFKPGGQGIEAICFVPDPAHPQGGTFFVANQSFTDEPGEERSLIVEVELPLRQSGAEGPVRIVNWFPPGVLDIAGLHYDAARGRLLAVSDGQNMLLEMTPRGRLERAWAVTGANQEGLLIGPDGMMYIAQDSGGVIKIRPLWPPD